MKNFLIALIAAMLLAACAPATEQGTGTPAEAVLLVTIGESQRPFSVKDLQALPSGEATFKDVVYKGVLVSVLLETIDVSPNGIKALKAVAADGYSVNYDPAQVLKDDVLVAYALTDGNPLTAEDGDFRMVLPDEEGKLNVRMLVELQIIQ